MKQAKSVWQVGTDCFRDYIIIAADIDEAIEKGRQVEQANYEAEKTHPGEGHLGTIIAAKLVYELDAL